jgi:hypothetical protein
VKRIFRAPAASIAGAAIEIGFVAAFGAELGPGGP